MVAVDLVSLGTKAGGGFVAGLLAGYGIKKVIKITWKIIAVGTGLFFTGVLALQAKGYVPGGIAWDRMGNDMYHWVNGTMGAMANGSYNGYGHEILVNLGIETSTGLGAGLLVGFAKG